MIVGENSREDDMDVIHASLKITNMRASALTLQRNLNHHYIMDLKLVWNGLCQMNLLKSHTRIRLRKKILNLL